MVNRALCLLVLLLMLGFVPASAQGLSLAVTDSSGDKLVELTRFFVQFDWRSDGSVDMVRRARPLFFIGHGTCRGKVEVNVAATEAVNHENGNWLEIAALQCALSTNTTVSVGRLFLAAPYSTPPPFLLRTVEYPKANTFAAYAYGAQLRHVWGSWSATADLTGNSGKQFDDSGNFDHVESSLRIGRKLGSVGTLSFTSQLSADNTRVALDWMSDSSQDLNVWTGVYYDDTTEELLGMVQISYPIGRRVRPHGMWDHRPNGIEEWTFGTEVLLRKEVRVVVDYEVEAERFLSRLQFHW